MASQINDKGSTHALAEMNRAIPELKRVIARDERLITYIKASLEYKEAAISHWEVVMAQDEATDSTETTRSHAELQRNISEAIRKAAEAKRLHEVAVANYRLTDGIHITSVAQDSDHVAQKETESSAVETIFKHCRGHGRSLAKQGSTWLTLGLAKFVIHYLEQRRQGINALDGIVDFSEEGAASLQRLIHNIQCVFATHKAEVVFASMSSEQGDLTEDEKWLFHLHLLKAYLPRLSAFHYTASGSLASMYYRSMAPCEVRSNEYTLLSLMDTTSLINPSERTIMFGVTHNLSRSSAGIGLFDWLMIPAEVIDDWRVLNRVNLYEVIRPRIHHEGKNNIEVDEEDYKPMSPSAISSIIKRTVAFDEIIKGLHCYAKPSELEGKVPGVYVIGLS
ncbi:unnamed protein product [Fusarium graminearum]|nr:unnamed protein product [Fusarium graminearum]